jgi:hypothetical protein
MRSFRTSAAAIVVLYAFCFAGAAPLHSQSRGLEAIRAADLKIHLDFLADPAFAGRPAPSAAVEIASVYLAQQAEMRGLKPILPDGSFFQSVPLEVITLSPAKSRLRVLVAGGEHVLYFPQSFGINMRAASEGMCSGGIVFIGTTRDANEKSLEAFDLGGKMAVALGVAAPETPRPAPGAPAPFSLSGYLREKGAVGFVTIISPDRENNLRERSFGFDVNEQLRFPSVDMSGWFSRRSVTTAGPAGVPPLPFVQVEVRHEAGADILGISPAELNTRFAAAAAGESVSAGPVEGRILEAEIRFDTRMTAASNVVGWIEGTDPKLKNEYITITGHQDHLPMREGAVFPGADDNGSGAVAMLELIEALMIERPKRSVIFVWSTAEERGLVGAFHFIQHCPVPVEKISANLNLDMISRNDPGMVYFVGSKALSSEFDQTLRAANDRSVRLRIDDTYQSPDHPEQFFFRSDQYPHIQFGIPGVWIFCGTTPDYHTRLDGIDRVDYAKMEKVTKFAYVACLDIGNKPEMMKLDVRPDVTERGPQNMKVIWRSR